MVVNRTINKLILSSFLLDTLDIYMLH